MRICPHCVASMLSRSCRSAAPLLPLSLRIRAQSSLPLELCNSASIPHPFALVFSASPCTSARHIRTRLPHAARSVRLPALAGADDAGDGGHVRVARARGRPLGPQRDRHLRPRRHGRLRLFASYFVPFLSFFFPLSFLSSFLFLFVFLFSRLPPRPPIQAFEGLMHETCAFDDQSGAGAGGEGNSSGTSAAHITY